jgi:hypothetical protein
MKFASQETVSNSKETESISYEMKMKNGFLKKISQEMKTVSWEIFFISSMFSAKIHAKMSKGEKFFAHTNVLTV